MTIDEMIKQYKDLLNKTDLDEAIIEMDNLNRKLEPLAELVYEVNKSIVTKRTMNIIKSVKSGADTELNVNEELSESEKIARLITEHITKILVRQDRS